MIFDQIQHLPKYSSVCLPHVNSVKDFLQTFSHRIPFQGEIEILGRDLFVRPSEFMTRNPDESRFEVHRVYADIQYVVEGGEVMQTALAHTPATEYDFQGDIQFLSSPSGISNILVPQGHFIIFFPGEAHRPCCHAAGRPGKVKKLVFKVKMPQHP